MPWTLDSNKNLWFTFGATDIIHAKQLNNIGNVNVFDEPISFYFRSVTFDSRIGTFFACSIGRNGPIERPVGVYITDCTISSFFDFAYSLRNTFCHLHEVSFEKCVFNGKTTFDAIVHANIGRVYVDSECKVSESDFNMFLEFICNAKILSVDVWMWKDPRFTKKLCEDSTVEHLVLEGKGNPEAIIEAIGCGRTNVISLELVKLGRCSRFVMHHLLCRASTLQHLTVFRPLSELDVSSLLEVIAKRGILSKLRGIKVAVETCDTDNDSDDGYEPSRSSLLALLYKVIADTPIAYISLDCTGDIDVTLLGAAIQASSTIKFLNMRGMSIHGGTGNALLPYVKGHISLETILLYPESDYDQLYDYFSQTLLNRGLKAISLLLTATKCGKTLFHIPSDLLKLLRSYLV